MNLGKFTFTRKLGHYEEGPEEIVHEGTPYEHKTRSRRWIEDGLECVTIEVTIDPQAVAKSVSSAASNKSGISKYLNGAVVGRVVSRSKVEGE